VYDHIEYLGPVLSQDHEGFINKDLAGWFATRLAVRFLIIWPSSTICQTWFWELQLYFYLLNASTSKPRLIS